MFAPTTPESSTLRYWVGWMDVRPACTAAATTHTAVNLVEWVSTTPDARRKGFGAAVTWAAAIADPSSPAFLPAPTMAGPYTNGPASWP